MFVSAIMLLSSLYAAEASVFQKARETALEAASPILSIFAIPAGFIQDFVGSVNEYFFVLEQNKALREEIENLRQWEQEARGLRDAIAAYETLGYYHPAPTPQPITATVVGESNEAFTHTMIVNAGRDNAVLPGQAVVDDRGLVGRIVHTSSNAARVLLLTDVQSRIPVYLETSEVEGILVGSTGSRPVISFTRFDDLEKVINGDRVVTSGAGETLPRGLPVGQVSNVSENGAVVQLDSNYARTRLVRIINYKFPGIREEEPPSLSSKKPTEAAPDPVDSENANPDDAAARLQSDSGQIESGQNQSTQNQSNQSEASQNQIREDTASQVMTEAQPTSTANAAETAVASTDTVGANASEGAQIDQ